MYITRLPPLVMAWHLLWASKYGWGSATTCQHVDMDLMQNSVALSEGAQPGIGGKGGEGGEGGLGGGTGGGGQE